MDWEEIGKLVLFGIVILGIWSFLGSVFNSSIEDEIKKQNKLLAQILEQLKNKN